METIYSLIAILKTEKKIEKFKIDCSGTLQVLVCIHSTCVQFSVSLMTTLAPKGTCNMQNFCLVINCFNDYTISS